MNRKLLWSGLLLSVWLAGCAMQHYATPPVYPGEPPRPLPEIRVKSTVVELLSLAAAQPVAPFGPEAWRDLFDGKSLQGWQETKFEQGGRIFVTNGLMVFQKGEPFVGANGTAPIPKINYEIAFDTMRLEGDDFFCGLTFPVRDASCSLIVGGWGGGIVGLSNVDGSNASENETTKFISFETGRWYRIRLRVTEQKIEAWIEQKKVVDLVTTGRLLEVRFGEILLSRPFGLCAWQTSAAYRAIKIREVSQPDRQPD